MKFTIKHEIKGRLRVHMAQNRMTCREADTLLYYLNCLKFVTAAKVYEATADVTISYLGSRAAVIDALRDFRYEKTEVPAELIETSGRTLNVQFKEALIKKLIFRAGTRLLLPPHLRACIVGIKSLKYLSKGFQSLRKRKIEVSVLDATAIGVSMVRKDFETAGSIMFLLGIGEILEQWTHKKSVKDLARSMSVHTGKVWLLKDGQQVLVPSSQVKKGDVVVVHMGNVIPFDGNILEGEALVNQASLTGEAASVRKSPGGYVYAGTVLEEGELVLQVKEAEGSSRFEKIVAMIEDSEKLKSALEGKALHMADKLVPYTFAFTGITYLLTRNVTKALSILMVDFSCALKLSTPIAVLSAIREASSHHITVKGGKYLEAVAEADTIIFDKTGTLTKARPTVVDVISFNGENPDELLRIAACIEEHFPHSMAKAVVKAATEKNIEHQELHSKVDYIVAHGISTYIEGKKAVIGSYHFVFEDERCVIPEGFEEMFRQLPEEYSHLYLGIENKLAAVICIEDPLREEAAAVIDSLRKTGIGKIVMMTGDSEKTASAIAKRIAVDEYYSEVLPEDKARYIEQEKAKGRKVIMVGDGINDSPALSAADVGIAISDGAEIAREIADIVIGTDNISSLLTVRRLSHSAMKRISSNYRFIVGFNAGLIGLGILGILQPTTSSLLHNTSTLGVSVMSMKDLLPE